MDSTSDVITTQVFGPRKPNTIKIFTCNLKGTKPLTDLFENEGVPKENIKALSDNLNEKDAIIDTLTELSENCLESDILLVYLGGTGARIGPNYVFYTAKKEPIIASLWLELFSKFKCELFVVISTSFSGLLIENAKDSEFTLPKKMSILASTPSDQESYSGPLLMICLNEKIFQKEYTSPKIIMREFKRDFKTKSELQIAQTYDNFTKNDENDDITTTVFGPRKSSSIKVFTCNQKGTKPIIDLFEQEGVPKENIKVLSGDLAEKEPIIQTLTELSRICLEEDILFVYLGGHGGHSNGHYFLSTTQKKAIFGSLWLELFSKFKCEVFIVISTCYSGLLIDNAKESKLTFPKKMSMLASTPAEKQAFSGSLVRICLNEKMFKKEYTCPKQIMSEFKRDFKTSKVWQIAQIYDNFS